jgi:hypothetical protein
MRYLAIAMIIGVATYFLTGDFCSQSKHHAKGCEKHGFTHTHYVERHGDCYLQYTNKPTDSVGKCATPDFWEEDTEL